MPVLKLNPVSKRGPYYLTVNGKVKQAKVFSCFLHKLLAINDFESRPDDIIQYGQRTVAWYWCTTPVLFCGHRHSSFLIWEENDGGQVE